LRRWSRDEEASSEGPIIRIVSFSEIAGCPTMRLDPSHYIPRHRVWECREADKSGRRGALLEAWLQDRRLSRRPK